MDLDNINGFTLKNLGAINVILGKNGCGKSYLLKQVEQGLRSKEEFGIVRYISPERGGLLNYEAGVDQAITNDQNWLRNQRGQNQSGNFRNQSAALFRQLEFLILRRIEKDRAFTTFDIFVDKINNLLDRIKINRHASKAFEIFEKNPEKSISAEIISSGEAELITLGIEFLNFVEESNKDLQNIIFVDEPDVHLHPDLQNRLADFIISILEDDSIKIVIATHSTALLAGLSASPDVRVAFMQRSDQSLVLKHVTDIDRAILPIFGAHPLSNVFNEAPILLVEGEDDERIWQQAVRTAQGRLRLYPCNVGGVDRLAQYENEVNNIVSAVYDNARACSLRDRDTHPELIDDVGAVIRMRLACRAAENLMLSDDVLEHTGTTWGDFMSTVEGWMKSNEDHLYHEDVRNFAENGFMRKDHDLKTIRNILVGLISNKPWEVLVGQAIARLTAEPRDGVPGSLREFLGENVCHHLLQLDVKLPDELDEPNHDADRAISGGASGPL